MHRTHQQAKKLTSRRSASGSPAPQSRAELRRLEQRLESEVDKAATHAFSSAFLVAGALALLALVPIALGGRR